jgi:tetratricopeptide (TPR) repeat protein
MDAVEETAGAGKLVVRERGIAAARTGEWQKAVGALEEALAIDPRDVTTRMYLAGALWMSGSREASRAQYLEAAKLEPANARAHMYLGRMAALEGRDRQAVEHLQQATDLDAELLPAWLNLAMARQRLRRFAPALAAYEDAIRLDPGNAHARLGRAFALIGLGRHADARRRIEEDLKVLPDEPVFVHTLARLLAASPDPTVRDGARALALAERIAPTLQTAQVVETAAMAAAELGRFGEAVQWQQVAIRAARDAGRADAAKRLTAMLAQYKSGRPCREPWDPADPAFAPPPLPIQFGEIDPAGAR